MDRFLTAGPKKIKLVVYIGLDEFEGLTRAAIGRRTSRSDLVRRILLRFLDTVPAIPVPIPPTQAPTVLFDEWAGSPPPAPTYRKVVPDEPTEYTEEDEAAETAGDLDDGGTDASY
jgi:hypothetical protein